MNIFEQATKDKLRFASSKGELTVEQLWDLPLQSRNQFDLDTIAKSVNRELKDAGEESFVAVKENAARATLQLKLDIIKHVIAFKMQQAEDARTRAARIEERDKLLKILGEKQDAALKDLSAEEIQKRLAELG